MTNREAIEVIKLAQAQVEWEYPMDYAAAFDMAISALQALDEIYAFIMKSEASETTDGVLEIFDALEAEELNQEAKHSTESSLTQKGLDTISRAAAIDVLISEPPEMNYGFYYAEKIKALPPTEPEPHWIPCTPSELPKKMLWVTHDNGLWRYVDSVYYDMTEWSESVSDVVAYMLYEKPEPYER